MSEAAIPVMRKPVDMMEVGPNGNNLQATAMAKHPVDEVQQRQSE